MSPEIRHGRAKLSAYKREVSDCLNSTNRKASAAEAFPTRHRVAKAQRWTPSYMTTQEDESKSSSSSSLSQLFPLPEDAARFLLPLLMFWRLDPVD